jgi:hypothetical protein
MNKNIRNASRRPYSAFVSITGRGPSGNIVEVFLGTIREAVNLAQSRYPDSDARNKADWLDVLTSDYRDVEIRKWKMKTQTEIVTETIQFYLADPAARRAKKRAGYSCHYAMPLEPSRRCAVGRCMTEEAIKEVGSYTGGVNQLNRDHGPLYRLLRAEYRGHSQEFWFNLQALHDEDCYWTADDAATRRGKLVRRCFPEALESCIELGLVAK